MKNKHVVVIIQARTDSRRLPKKVLSTIKGKPLLWHVIDRTKHFDCDDIVVATTKRKIDDEIVSISKASGVKFFRGKKNDVLDRYYQAAIKFNAEIIIRITADCPLIDPKIVQMVLKKFQKGSYDYVATDDETYPKGIDVECFSFNSIKKSWLHAKLKSDREHVTSFIWRNTGKFKTGKLYYKSNFTKPVRLVVDHKNDLELVRKIYANLYKKNKIFFLDDVIRLVKAKPELLEMNTDHNPDEGYLYSLKND